MCEVFNETLKVGLTKHCLKVFTHTHTQKKNVLKALKFEDTADKQTDYKQN